MLVMFKVLSTAQRIVAGSQRVPVGQPTELQEIVPGSMQRSVAVSQISVELQLSGDATQLIGLLR
jgi:hypothetical protein